MGKGALAILALALVLRLGILVLGPDLALIGDAGDYDRHAQSIAAGDGYPDTVLAEPGSPTALRPPGYPFWLGAIYALSGDSVEAARVAGALLGTLSVLLVLLIAGRLWDRRTALVAGGLAAVSPALVYVNGSLVSEQIFLPLMLGAVLVTLIAREADGRRLLMLAGLAGALCGLAALTRVVGIVLVAAIAIGLWRRWSAIAVAAVAAVLVVTPWVVRNNAVFDSFVPVATQEGFNLYGTYNSTSYNDGNFRLPPRLPEVAPLFGREGWDESRISSELGRRAREFAFEHPRYVLRVAWLNVRRTLRLADQPMDTIEYEQLGVPAGMRTPLEIGVVVMLLLAAAGAVSRRARVAPLFVWLVPLLLFIPVVLFLATPRYRLPLDPFLVMLAALTLVQAASYLRGRPAG